MGPEPKPKLKTKVFFWILYLDLSSWEGGDESEMEAGQFELHFF